jgi:hypothetical protein
MRPYKGEFMFGEKKPETQLDAAINRCYVAMETLEETHEEYGKILEHLVKLHKMKEDEKPSRVSPDTMLTVGANLVGILLIIRHEHVNVITSRAMTLIRPK